MMEGWVLGPGPLGHNGSSPGPLVAPGGAEAPPLPLLLSLPLPFSTLIA